MAKHDSFYKELLSDPDMLGSTLRVMVALGILPAGLVEQLNLKNITYMPTEFITDKLEKRIADLACRIPVRGRRGAKRRRSFRYPMFEFQSEPDTDMPWRIIEYAILFSRTLAKQEGLEAHELLSRVISITIHNGGDPWNVTTASPPPDAGEVKAPPVAFQYFVLDIETCEIDHLPLDEPMSHWILLERARSEVEIAEALGTAFSTFPGAEYRKMRALFHRRAMHSQWLEDGLEIPSIEEVEEMLQEEGGAKKVETVMNRNARLFAEKLRGEGRHEGRVEGLNEALEVQRAMLCSQADLRFGKEISGHLSDLIARIDDFDRLSEVSKSIVTCETGEELLARLNGKG